MFNFMYTFEHSYLEFILKTSISKKHTLMNKGYLRSFSVFNSVLKSVTAWLQDSPICRPTLAVNMVPSSEPRMEDMELRG